MLSRLLEFVYSLCSFCLDSGKFSCGGFSQPAALITFRFFCLETKERNKEKFKAAISFG